MHGLLLSVAWWLSVTSLLVIVLVSSTAALISMYIGFASRNSYKNVYKIPMRPMLTYLEWFRRAQKQKSIRVFILRMMSAICKVLYTHRLVLLWIGIRPVVVFFRPELIEVLLNNSKTISKAIEYRFLQPWLGTGLLTSTGEKWRSHRKLLTPSFHFQILENFLITFNEEAAVLTKKLKAEVGKPWLDIVPMITLCTLDTICQTAMGVHLNVQSGGGKDYIKKIEEIADQFWYRVIRPWLWPDTIFFYCSRQGRNFCKNVNFLHDFTRKVIKEKKEYMLKDNADGRDNESLSGKRRKKAFLELLLELHLTDDSFTEENIREEVDTFMFEGHDTTAMSISWTLYELGHHPDIQEKVYQELEDILGSDREREFTSEDLKQMKYLECTIKESLRLYPSVSFIARQLTEKITIDEFTLEPGCTCFICIFMLHMDPEQFPCPERFDPDRFLPENSHKRHPYAYIPFSAGPRNCIGQRFAMMEEKTMIAHVVRKFKITSLDTPDQVEIMAGLVSKNADPVRLRLELRDSESEEPEKNLS